MEQIAGLFIGGKVRWDDDEEGFSGIYEITAIRGKKGRCLAPLVGTWNRGTGHALRD